jgi:acyl transferase domain-containing protein/non-ribosomal peptide synthetase component F
MVDRSPEGTGSEIAVVGLAGRFPGAASVGELWRLLREGREGIASFTEAELLAAGVTRQELEDPAYVRAGGALDGHDLFDAPFFGFSPREAEITDPQHRVFLECAWQALEDAGYDASSYPGSIGVFASATLSTYLFLVQAHPEAVERVGRHRVLLGNDKDYLPTWTSYKLDLRGPSVGVNTSCSSALVAVHLACQSLLNGECDMALAGGVSIKARQRRGYRWREGGIESPDGHCRAFDARARGSVAGHGAGVVVLKRLADALADGDTVHAVIKGSAVNNDGSLKAGYTAPSEEGQARVVSEALAMADADPATIGYVEAHGTGTELGDPIEVAALARAFGAAGRGFCALGSIKTNIGHLDSAAGAAGLIKAVLAVEHGVVPPSLHFETPNPRIDFASSPFYVNTALSPWPLPGPRRAGVSSFGIGGTNAHAVLEEPPPAEPTEPAPARPHQLLVLSARTPEALDEAGRNLAAHCRAHPGLDPADVAWTLQVGRKAFEHRRAFVFRGLADLAETLEAPDPRRVWSAAVEETGERPVAFLFPGQGTQYPGMGRELYDGEETFRDAVDRCAGGLAPHLGLDLARLLYPAPEDEEEAARKLAETAFAQPALFTVEYALAQLWMEWGVRPQAMLGHSAGELVAACLAGVFTLEDALGLVAVRGRLTQALGGGAMLSVPLPPEELEPLLNELEPLRGGDLSLAAVNGPRLTVASGPAAAVEALAEELAGRGVRARRMRNSRAFHSAMMEPALAPFAAAVARVERRPPRLPYLSNVTGTWIRPEEATDPHYWARHLRQTVRFADGLGELLRAPGRVLVEVGPGATLGTLVKRHPDRRPEQAAVPSLPQDRDGGSAAAQMAGAAGRLWLAGAAIDWRGFHGRGRRRIPLPTYPFERRRYWIEPAGEEAPRASTAEAPAAAPPALYARPGLPTAYAPPETETERQLAALWQELLGIEPVGRHDAFLELGGHSLLLVEVGARLDRTFGVRLPMRELAEAATLADLAAAVERHRAGRGEDWTGDALPVLAPVPDERHLPFPLTEVQEAYWLGRSGAFALGNVATHEYSEIDVPGLDLERLTRAWRRLIDRHEMLRAVVLPDGRQQILERVPPYEIETLDLRGMPPAEAEEALLEARRRMSHQVIPADRWPLFEVRASLLPDGVTRVHLSLDLLIVDAWSVQLLFRELGLLYADPEAPLPPLELSYRDYLLADVAFRDSETFRRSLEYWRRRLPSLPGPPELPLARSPESIDSPRFARRNGRLAAEPWERLKARAAASGLTASGLLLAAFSEVLAAWSKGPRFLLNLTLFNRLPIHPQVGEVVGDFTSLVLLEVDAAGAGPFEERARRLQRRLWEDLDHRHVSGVRVLRERARSAGNAGGAAAPVVFTSLLVGTPRRDPAEPAADPLPRADYVIGQTPQVWIDHVVGESEAGLSYFWEAVEDLFPPGLLDDMFAAYQGLLARLADEPETWQARPSLTPAEHRALQAAANATAAPISGVSGARHHPLFVEPARRDPGRPAVLSAARNLTYGELRRRAAHLGRRLRELGARPNRLVAVVLDKGWEQAAAVLGVLRSGAAYLPVDPGLPEERRLHLLRAGEVEIALTSSRLDAALSWPGGVARLAVDLEEPDFVLDDGPDDEPPLQGPDDLAYVIFTSGSTGSPKGVMIDHRGAVNTVLDVNRRFRIGPRDRSLALSALSFDLSVWDLFGPLAAGGAVVFPEPRPLAGADREPRGDGLELSAGADEDAGRSCGRGGRRRRAPAGVAAAGPALRRLDPGLPARPGARPVRGC